MAPKNKNKKKDKKKSENQKNEAKEELNKDEQVRKQQLNELNDLIDKILNIFNTMSDVPPSWFAYVNKFKEDVNEPSNEYYDETEIDQAIHRLQTFISSMKLDEKQTKELEEIIGCVQTVAHKLFDDITNIRQEIKNIKKDKQDVYKQLDNLKTDNNHLQSELIELKNEFSKLNENSTNRVLKETYAHLLRPLIEQISEEFERKNEETKDTLCPTSYNMLTNYNKRILKKIKSGETINDEPIQLVNHMIGKFANAAKLSNNQVLELLLGKTERNYSTHGCINNFIVDLINGEYTTDDFIKYIEGENGISLCINNKQQQILMKLLQYNILHHLNSNDRS